MKKEEAATTIVLRKDLFGSSLTKVFLKKAVQHIMQICMI